MLVFDPKIKHEKTKTLRNFTLKTYKRMIEAFQCRRSKRGSGTAIRLLLGEGPVVKLKNNGRKHIQR